MIASDPSQERRQRQRDAARAAILAATEDLLVAGGQEGFSIRKLADRCGYAAPTIYHYFGDKQGLVDSLLEERFQQLLRLLKRVRHRDEPLEATRANLMAFARFGLRHPTHYWLLTLPRDPELEPPPSAEAARALLERPLERLASEGRLTIDFEAARQSIWALLHGLITLRTSRPDEPWAPRLIETAVDALLRGVVQAPRRRASRGGSR